MKRAYGFTIVELLIVIVVIAILAAISVAAYTNISDRANDTAVQSDLNSLGKSIKLHLVEKGSLPGASAGTIRAGGFTPAKSSYGDGFVNAVGAYNLVYCRSTNTNDFGLVAWSKSGNGYAYKDGRVQSYSNTPTGSTGACPGSGVASPYTYFWSYNAGSWAV